MENIFTFLLILGSLLVLRLLYLVSKLNETPKKKIKLTPDLIKVNGKTTKVLRTKKGTFAKKKK